jgi:tetratricopeptide (TPR) repeat protein
VIAGRDEDAVDEFNRVHRVVIDALNVVHVAHRDVYEALRDSADALHHRKQGSEGVAQILFHRSFPLKRDSERAALERRVAAWLYLDQRLNAGETLKDDRLHELYVRLGNEVSAGLLNLGGEADVELATTIRRRVKELPLIASLLLDASTARTSGDTYRGKGDHELGREEYEDGVASLDEALEVLRGEPWKGFCEGALDDVDQKALSTMVDVLGSRGGLLQRLGRTDDAQASYDEGAELERRFRLGSTYNRLNAVKCRIRSGARLESLLANIQEIATTIEGRIAVDQATRDRGWTWSDLGDCRALLGDLGGAEQAYSAFIARSETKSPKRALEVLSDIHASLERAGDPGAPRVGEAISTLQSRLEASGA